MNFFGTECSLYKANLHMHSTNSDGGYSPEELIDLYSKKSYDILAFTDHRKTNMVSSYDGKNMLLISGIELHPPGPGNIPWHLLALNVPPDIPGEYETAQKAIETVLIAGGIVFCAHPHWCGFSSGDVLKLNGIEGIEVYNTSCRFIGKDNNEQCWDELLNAGFLKGAIAVDDTHSARDLFRNWTMIAAKDKTLPSIMEALKKGNYFATQGPLFHRLELKGRTFEADFSEAEEVIILTEKSKGICVTAPDNPAPGITKTLTTCSCVIPDHIQSFIRCRIRDKEGRCAWTNPIILS